MPPAATKYECVIGLDFEPEGKPHRRFEPGDTVPVAVVKRSPWLLNQGVVREVTSDG